MTTLHFLIFVRMKSTWNKLQLKTIPAPSSSPSAHNLLGGIISNMISSWLIWSSRICPWTSIQSIPSSALTGRIITHGRYHHMKSDSPSSLSIGGTSRSSRIFRRIHCCDLIHSEPMRQSSIVSGPAMSVHEHCIIRRSSRSTPTICNTKITLVCALNWKISDSAPGQHRISFTSTITKPINQVMVPFIAFITIMPVSWVHAFSIHIQTQTGMISLTSWSTPLGRTLLMLILLLRNVVRITMMMVIRWAAPTPLHPCLSTCEATKDLQHLLPWCCVPRKSGMLLKITSKRVPISARTTAQISGLPTVAKLPWEK